MAKCLFMALPGIAEKAAIRPLLSKGALAPLATAVCRATGPQQGPMAGSGASHASEHPRHDRHRIARRYADDRLAQPRFGLPCTANQSILKSSDLTTGVQNATSAARARRKCSGFDSEVALKPISTNLFW